MERGGYDNSTFSLFFSIFIRLSPAISKYPPLSLAFSGRSPTFTFSDHYELSFLQLSGHFSNYLQLGQLLSAIKWTVSICKKVVWCCGQDLIARIFAGRLHYSPHESYEIVEMPTSITCISSQKDSSEAHNSPKKPTSHSDFAAGGICCDARGRRRPIIVTDALQRRGLTDQGIIDTYTRLQALIQLSCGISVNGFNARDALCISEIHEDWQTSGKYMWTTPQPQPRGSAAPWQRKSAAVALSHGVPEA